MSALVGPRRGFLSLGLWLAIAAVALVMTVLVAAIVRTLKHVKPVRSTVPPVSAIVWGDRVFLTRQPLAGWLRVHGVNYGVWATRHKPANRLLGRRAAANNAKR
jgi:hypothetical protein